MVTDLHIEAFQPMHIASIAYEVCQGLVSTTKKEHFKNHFDKMVQSLEANQLKVFDGPTS